MAIYNYFLFQKIGSQAQILAIQNSALATTSTAALQPIDLAVMFPQNSMFACLYFLFISMQ